MRRLPVLTVQNRVFSIAEDRLEPWAHLAQFFSDSGRKFTRNDRERLCEDFFHRTLTVGEVFSVPKQDPDDWSIWAVGAQPDAVWGLVATQEDVERMVPERVFFKVLRQKPAQKRSVRVAGDPLEAAHPSDTMQLQLFNQWAGGDAAGQEPVHLYAQELPQVISLLALAPWAYWRAACIRWVQAEHSDVEGCEDFVKGSVCSWAAEADVGSLPTVVRLERLAVAGWRPGREEDHKHTDVDDRLCWLGVGFARVPSYFAVLLGLENLILQGAKEVWPGQPEAYYELVLEFPAHNPPPGHNATQYQELLQSLRAGADEPIGMAAIDNTASASASAQETVGMAELGVARPVLRALPRGRKRRRDEPALAAGALADSGVPVEAVGVEAGPASADLRAQAALGEERGPDDEAVGTGSGERVPAALLEQWRQATAPDLPIALRGRRVRVEVCSRPTHGPPYVRCRVDCGAAGHVNCFRWRSCSQSWGLGQRAVLGYLAAWLDAADRPAATDRHSHMSERVSKADAVAAMDTI